MAICFRLVRPVTDQHSTITTIPENGQTKEYSYLSLLLCLDIRESALLRLVLPHDGAQHIPENVTLLVLLNLDKTNLVPL